MYTSTYLLRMPKITQEQEMLESCVGKRKIWQMQNPAYPTVTSKMLDPTEDDTAMSPKPFLATMTLVIRSGMEVPAARKVRPMT